ncbi:hypothetical protein [Aquella oligotrophica]|uniref:Uncharacterized protein n=1 Tax=Aquella oligotrophica TaxID=2067065 RepID=A0A2I7N757_9NEIS|nr:hypothetical protein [Aquella oligotrophica]AUR52035.1 hypothetical protein CUN60_06895 [Aquella oligotrophica]
MPNWCQNDLQLTGQIKVLKPIIENALKNNGLFNAIIPMPEELSTNDNIMSKEQQESNCSKYGHYDWFCWRLANWSTKWDTDISDSYSLMELEADTMNKSPDDEITIHLYFDTAWSPPIAVYQALEEINIQVLGYYYEPGCAYCGWYEDGYDSCNSFSGYDDIPSDILAVFGIEKDDFIEE